MDNTPTAEWAELRKTIRSTIARHWHHRITEQIAAAPEGHIDAFADATADAVLAWLEDNRAGNETFEEWRVTGRPNAGYQPFEFTWHGDRGDTEAAALAFLDYSSSRDWIDGPHLHRRTITRTPWQQLATDTQPDDVKE